MYLFFDCYMVINFAFITNSKVIITLINAY